MRRLFFTISVVVGICAKPAFCQKKKDEKHTPYRTKIAELSFHTLYDYNTTSESSEYGNANSEVERDKRVKAKLGIPLSMKDGKLMGLQLKYEKQNFLFDFEDAANDYELYNHLENRSFTSLGARFLYQKPISENKEITFVAGGEIKSDVIRLSRSTSKYFASFGYKVNLNQRTKIGGTLVIGYSLKVPQVYPVFNYERTLSPHWTLDLALPKQAALRYKASEKFYVTAKAELKGWRYAIHNDELSGESTTMIRKSDLQLGLSFERELHDWLWFGLDMGVAENLRYYLAETGDRRRDALIDLQSNSAPFVKFGIFMVPPKKFYK